MGKQERKGYASGMAYDPRYIANLILDRAADRNIDLTNAEVNKIIYFLHAFYLAEFSQPLIDAKIEAWDYGPVVREVCSEFKSFGARPISRRAQRLDTRLLIRIDVYEEMAEQDFEFLAPIIDRLSNLGASRLIGISHEKGGPWDIVYNRSGRVNPGMEISDKIIREYYLQQTRH